MAEVETNNAAVFDLINNETHDESHQINSPDQPQRNYEQEDRIVEDEQNEQADQGNQEDDNLKGKNNTAEVEEPQTAAYSNAEHNETLVNLNSAEVKSELLNLHSKVDQILGRYVIPRHTYELGTLVQPNNIYSLSASHEGFQHFEFLPASSGSNYTHNLTSYNNPFSARDAIDAREERVLRSSVKSHTKSTTYASPIHHEHKPSYDVEKLDRIISKIVGAPIRTSYISNNHYERESYRTISPVRESVKEANLNQSLSTQEIFLASGSRAIAALGSYAKKISTQSSPVVRFSDTPVRSSYKDIVVRESETVKRSSAKPQQVKQVQQVQQEAYFCGEVENDVDSMVMDYMDDAAHEIENKKEQYTNHYVGNLVDDADEAPRTKRVGKRQQIISAKKGQVVESNEFVKKGLYEQKNKVQVNATQAERYFENDANKLQDFEF